MILDTENIKIDETGIGIFDGFFTEEECDFYICFHDMAEKCGLTYKHPSNSVIVADDSRADIAPPTGLSYDMNYNVGNFQNKFFDQILPIYEKHWQLEKYTGIQMHQVKVQRTRPGEGYHSFHTEKSTGKHYSYRLFVAMMYLNDIEEGGETEFLKQKVRIKPKMGRVVIFPANYTHIHRGNPPFNKDKYIITGWATWGWGWGENANL